MKTYRVTIGFAGYDSEASEVYQVDADSIEKAVSKAMELAHYDLSVDDVEELE